MELHVRSRLENPLHQVIAEPHERRGQRDEADENGRPARQGLGAEHVKGPEGGPGRDLADCQKHEGQAQPVYYPFGEKEPERRRGAGVHVQHAIKMGVARRANQPGHHDGAQAKQ